ncbi:MAG: 16S rRNA (cytosine(967)-C(5))-methyltransferase RsmB [Pseudomonadales bacterium]|nr:16S rRNA (cytosine(967)-C(5))-methyltransferase RsmB [Pseudomonadales bacterium]
MDTRAIAAEILTKILIRQQSLNELLPYRDAQLSLQDEALVQALCYGVCRWQLKLNCLVQKLLDKPLKQKDTNIHALLLLGLYQLLYMRIPAHAAVSETVQACTTLGKPWARGLINAVLRRFQRDQEELQAELSASPEYQYSHPSWLLTRLKQAWPNSWEDICVANNTQAPMTLRVNQQKIRREDYLHLLANNGIDAHCCRWSSSGIQLSHASAVNKLPQFDQGVVSVQDEAAQIAASLMELESGLRVLDACAAPGGKTCHLLEQEPELAELVALEYDNQRLIKIKENLERLGLNATLVEGDATSPENWWDKQPFDRILLDAPCSAIGVIRRHPDIKLLRRNADIDKLASQQLAMLEVLWPLLKPGGLLLYATCSILPEENEQLIKQFIGNTVNARFRKINAQWGIAAEYGRYLLPTVMGNDGFYYAKITKDISL